MWLDQCGQKVGLHQSECCLPYVAVEGQEVTFIWSWGAIIGELATMFDVCFRSLLVVTQRLCFQVFARHRMIGYGVN